EALRAQAVVARTYAAYQRQISAGKPYQIVASTAHQVFAGRVSPASPAWNAVQDTAGQVLRWEGELFPAFYHSESGGYTEDPRTSRAAATATAWVSASGAPRVWPSRAIPPAASWSSIIPARRSASSTVGNDHSDHLAGLREGRHSCRHRDRRPRISRGPPPGVPAVDRLRGARRQALERADHAPLPCGGIDRPPRRRRRELSAQADRPLRVGGDRKST